MEIQKNNRYITFNDVLIRPKLSNIEPHEARVVTECPRDFLLQIPILSAAMDKVTDARMAQAIGEIGGLGVLHRNCSVAEQVRMVSEVVTEGYRAAAACGPFDFTSSSRVVSSSKLYREGGLVKFLNSRFFSDNF